MINHEVWHEILQRNWLIYLAIAFVVGFGIGVSL